MNKSESSYRLARKRMFEQENYVFNECEDWLRKYKETYKKFEAISLVSKKEGQVLKISSLISEIEDNEEESRYHFSLNLDNLSGKPFLRGPSISIDAKNKDTINYLLVAITENYLNANNISHVELLENDGLQLICNQGIISSLEISGIREGEKDWYSFVEMVANSKNNKTNKDMLSLAYNMAKEEKIKQDDIFRKSIDQSDDSFLYVYSYQKKKETKTRK